MSILKIDEAGIDRCDKCRKTAAGGWIGRGKGRFFWCTQCIGNWLRKLAKIRRNVG